MPEEVCILMSTYNGEKYIKEQIESLLKQRDINVKIIVRDDGSSDSTTDILEDFKNKGILEWYSGKNLKSAKSFYDLIMKAPQSKYYAFCDQDDVWSEDKLKKAVDMLKNSPENKPAVYSCPLALVDENLNAIVNNRKDKYSSETGACLISNNVAGCTMVFNQALLNMLRIHIPEKMTMHDDWAYKVAVFTGADVYRDSKSYIKYRQHSNNVIGAQTKISSKIKRRLKRIKDKKNVRLNQLIEIYDVYKDFMPEKNKELVECIVYYKKNLKRKILLLKNKKISTKFRDINFFYRIDVIFGLF